jgi:hypothetical protein
MIALQSRQTNTIPRTVNVYERRLIVRDGSIFGMNLMHQFSKYELPGMMRTWIPESISKIGPNLFSGLGCFHSISIETDSRLTRI